MNKQRILIVDILRGFALLLIVLIHYVEHFEIFKAPEIRYIFSAAFDHRVMDFTYLLISGKAYSIFALLFGLSFAIQMDNQAQKGIDYRWGFLWRMTILLIIGFLHSLVYRGDILHLYAILSLSILFLYRVKLKYLWMLTILLALQLPLLFNLIHSFINPEVGLFHPIPVYWAEGDVAYASSHFKDVLHYNLWQGRLSVWSWSLNNGRIWQLMALFILGLILGRKKIFHHIDQYEKQVLGLLIISIGSIVTLAFLMHLQKKLPISELQHHILHTVGNSFLSLSGTAGFISLLSWVYLKVPQIYLFKLFAAYGKMSLSNYIFQALFGVLFFYGFGLAMYRYMGSTWSILMGGVVFFTQALISIKWNEKYYYGPMEWFWRCCTQLNFSIKMRRST